MLIFFLLLATSCDSKWKGQAPLQKLDTQPQPIQQEFKQEFDLGSGIKATNNFAGARVSGMIRTNDTLITALINPENTPINSSPWYALKIWSSDTQEIHLKIKLLQGVRNRYYPKISQDGKEWIKLDSTQYFEGPVAKRKNKRKLPDYFSMRLKLSPDTLWIAAQELITSRDNSIWTDSVAQFSFTQKVSIGESLEGRPIELLNIGNGNDKEMLMVLSRQHPPELSGYLAMQTFIESICADTELAKKFRARFNTYVIPMLNPDGVDRGHWRHSAGGVDLNRDWEDFEQKETVLVKEFMEQKVVASGGTFLVGLDFHSTYEDIFYTIDPSLKGNMPGVIPAWIDSIGARIADYEPNVEPKTEHDVRISSVSYFFYAHGAESVVYEVGDATDREFVKQKAKVAAIELMRIMLE